MAPRKPAEDTEQVADDFSFEEIAAHLTQTLAHISATGGLWPGMVKLPSEDREGNVGKLVAQLEAPLRALFLAITPAEDDDAKTRAAKQKLAAVFNSMLGAQDRGKDDTKFEVELLLRRLERTLAEQKIVAALKEATARFADDALNTGEMVVGPGLQALEVARTAAATNPEFRSLLAPMLDSLSDMTKKARQRQDEVRKSKKKKDEGEPS